MKIENKILAIIYREKDKKNELLALRNNPQDPKHGGDFYFVVTGGLKKEESFISAVKREIKEETGITNIVKIINLKLAFEYVYSDDGECLCKEKAYLVKIDGEVGGLNEEHIGFLWLNRTDFIETIKWEGEEGKKDLIKILDKIK